VDDLGPAGAGQPDARIVSSAVQVSAAPVLSDEGHQGVEHVRHGAGRLARTQDQGPIGPAIGECYADPAYHWVLLADAPGVLPPGIWPDHSRSHDITERPCQTNLAYESKPEK
jgi:hypothetical protein